MITAIIQQKGKPIPEVVSQEIGKLAEKHTLLLAAQHKKELDKSIEETRVRPLKEEGLHLSEQIHVEKLSNATPGYGVGNVETLNQKAPWWVWINFGRAGTGRTIPPSDIGSFTGLAIPTNGSKGGTWQHKKHGVGGKMYLLIPTKAISAHNYIEKALGRMISKAKEIIK